MIELVTFTGVDETTPGEALLELAAKYPFCEFAVLAGTRTGTLPRFPPIETIEQWRLAAQRARVHSAIHLCGRYARAICEGLVSEAAELAAGFGRVQVNLPPDQRQVNAKRVEAFGERIGATPILQHGGPWYLAPGSGKGRTEYLFDRSGGRGIRAIDEWPSPPHPAGRRVGYAGGISPATIDEALVFASRFPDSRLWLDMESGVRTDDRFDRAAVETVCRHVDASGLAAAA